MVHGIFLRGPAAALLDRVGVPAADLLVRVADPDADFGTGVSLPRLKDLAYFDGPIRYDGYPALARHIYAREQANVPFVFFTNVTLSVVKFRLHYLGFKKITEVPPEKFLNSWRDSFVLTDLYRRMSVLVSPKVTPLRPASKADYLRIIRIDNNGGIDDGFASTFTSAEDWVSHKERYPFKGATKENTCLLYRPLLFFDINWIENWLKESLTPNDFKDWEYAEILERIKGMSKKYETSYYLPDMVCAKTESTNMFNNHDDRLYRLGRRFKQHNTSDPSTRMRGGRRTYTGSGEQNTGSDSDNISESFADMAGKRLIEIDNPVLSKESVMEYYHVDTDPILTIAAMMFAFATMEPKKELVVANGSHGLIDSGTNTMVPLPQGVTVISTIQGLISNGSVMRRLFEGAAGSENVPILDTNANYFIENVEYAGDGVLYRDVQIEPNMFYSSMFGGEIVNPNMVLWSMYIIHRMFKQTDHKEFRIPNESLRSLGQFVRSMKEGFFWYDELKIYANHCQKVGTAESHIEKLFSVYWVNYTKELAVETNNLIDAQRADHDNPANQKLTTEQKDRRGYETPNDVVGFRAFQTLSSVGALNDTLRNIYGRMPEMFRADIPVLMNVEQFSEFHGDGGVTYNDMLTIGKRFFVTNYLGINVDNLIAERGNNEFTGLVEEATTEKLTLHQSFNIFKDEGTQELLKRELAYVPPDLNNITAGDVFEGIYDVAGMNERGVRKKADLTFKKFYDDPGYHHESFGGRRIPSASVTSASSAPSTGDQTRGRAYDKLYGLATIAAGLCVVAASAVVGAITGD